MAWRKRRKMALKCHHSLKKKIIVKKKNERGKRKSNHCNLKRIICIRPKLWNKKRCEKKANALKRVPVSVAGRERWQCKYAASPCLARPPQFPLAACVSGHHLQFSHSLSTHSGTLLFYFFARPRSEAVMQITIEMTWKCLVWRVEKKGEKKDENRGGNVKRRRWQQESVAYLRAPATRKKMAPGKAENERWKEPARLPLSDNVCPSALQISLLERKNNVLFDCGQQMQFTFVGAAEWFLPKDIKKRNHTKPNRFIDSFNTHCIYAGNSISHYLTWFEGHQEAINPVASGKWQQVSAVEKLH